MESKKDLFESIPELIGNVAEYCICELRYSLDFFIIKFRDSVSHMIDGNRFEVFSGFFYQSIKSFASYVLYGKFQDDKNLPEPKMHKTKHYWLFYTITKFCIKNNISLRVFLQKIDCKEILAQYERLHTYDYSRVDSELLTKFASRKSNLKVIREQDKLSQSDLARLSGVELKTIQSYEQSQDKIQKASIDNLKKLASVLKCPITDLLDECTDKTFCLVSDGDYMQCIHITYRIDGTVTIAHYTHAQENHISKITHDFYIENIPRSEIDKLPVKIDRFEIMKNHIKHDSDLHADPIFYITTNNKNINNLGYDYNEVVDGITTYYDVEINYFENVCAELRALAQK